MLRITPDVLEKRPLLISIKIDGVRYRLVPYPAKIGRPSADRKQRFEGYPEADYILKYCARHFGRLPDSLTRRQTKNAGTVKCRSITFAMLMKYSRCGSNAIGIKFNCDHATVLWGKNNAWQQYSKKEDWKSDIKLLDAHFEENVFQYLK
jgi:hypothetical protein